MPNLKQSLMHHDLGHLQIIAEHWGIEFNAPDVKVGLSVLVDQLLNADLTVEIIEALPEQGIQALGQLQEKNGRIPWVQFTRQFGQVREMGPGRRDRERPDRDPESAAEVLWYRGFVARAFYDTARGTEEFAYIPEDLLRVLPDLSVQENNVSGAILGRPATPPERADTIPVTDRIIDHATTCLSALRVGVEFPSCEPIDSEFIHQLIKLLGLLDPMGVPDPATTKTFLEDSRGEALASLAQTWLTSTEHNDLHFVPGLKPEGQWTNDPLGTRQFIVKIITAIPHNTWWSISALIADIHQKYPDFQRPAGDYDSWFIRDAETGEFLRGFEHWAAVEGALIRYMITGPLHWLGIVDLAAPEEGTSVTAFRLSGWATNLLNGHPPPNQPEELSKIHFRSDGRLSVPILAPRTTRYQVSRFCYWEGDNPHEYKYRLTSKSLQRAREQGLRVGHLLSILRRHAETIPPNILTALNRWDEHGTQARVQDVQILRLSSPEILQALRKSRAARFLGDPLGPTTVIVKLGAGEKVLGALVEMGYLGENIEPDDK
jgi:hypothetical protein